jgi:probable F420-dependent oxidoreductase
MSHPRRLRFGVAAEHARSPEALVETARKAEAAGYATLLLRDHFIEEPFGHQLAPLVALATVASVTSTLRIGTHVIANDYRHPVMLAKEAASLDALSGGRFELGIGAGFSQSEYARAGMPFDPPGVRVDRLEEALRVIKGLFADGPCTFSGRHYRVANLDSFPKPAQRPHPPLLVAGAGRRMLSIAAREADIVGIQSVSTGSGAVTDDPVQRLAETVAEKLEWIRRAAGDRFDRLELSTTCAFTIADDRRQAAERVAHARGWSGISADHVLEMPSLCIGSVDQIVEQLRARRERLGLSYYVVSDASLETAAPIVAHLAGR